MSRSKRPTQIPVSTKKDKPVRIRLIDWRSAILTILLVLVCLSVILVMQIFGWFDHIAGQLLLIVIAFFTCALLFDIGLIFTACITVAEGAVNAGKDKAGTLMLFHCESVAKIELRDAKTDEPIDETAKTYRKVRLTFVMKGGRVNQREVNFITQKQLEAIRAAIQP